MLQPEHDGGHGEHRQVVDGPLLVAGGNPAELLEPVHQAFDHIPLPVGSPVELDPSLSRLSGNYDPDARRRR